MWKNLEKGWAEKDRIRADEAAKEQAEWDALPEEKKQRINTLLEEKERLIAERELENQRREWQRRGITPRFFEATWENWIAETPEQAKVLEKVKKAWDKNLFIVGGNGAGKTHLAMCLAKDGATYCLMPELFRYVRENMKSEQEIIDRYGNCKLLILDEAGRQKSSDFEHNLLFEIIDKRWNNILPTTIIGNIGEEVFSKLYGAAITDRLRPSVINFNWGSKRGKTA